MGRSEMFKLITKNYKVRHVYKVIKRRWRQTGK